MRVLLTLGNNFLLQVDLMGFQVYAGCTAITSGRMEVNGANLHYQRTGCGDHVLLLLPGALGSSQTDFGPQLKFLNKDIFTIIGWDPRGYGLSIPPARDYPADFFSRDAKDAVDLMQAMNFKRFSLLGWSDGGITALIAAGSYPSLINKLVVWGANAYVTEEDLDLYNAVKDVTNWSPKMRKPLEDLYGKEYFANTFSAWVEAMTHFSRKSDGTEIPTYDVTLGTTAGVLYCSRTAQKSGNICRHLLPHIRCPTLIIHGMKDPMVPSFHAWFLHQQVKNSRLKLMRDGKHNLHLRFTEEFNRLVEDFLCSA
ncbi:serine hydrolase BPHL isoform X2 [Rhinoderma darwinii]|uniref:serine hydrolase BPHL isoform X2 n=1 Tax=Rhinoderma darwinii TaxID=43563 RepID=UPI003F67A435